MAQGDPLRPLRGRARLRSGEHGRPPCRRARRLRDARRRQRVPRLCRRACSRTTTRSRSPTRAPSTASARSPTRWSTCARPLPRPSRRASSTGPRPTDSLPDSSRRSTPSARSSRRSTGGTRSTISSVRGCRTAASSASARMRSSCCRRCAATSTRASSGSGRPGRSSGRATGRRRGARSSSRAATTRDRRPTPRSTRSSTRPASTRTRTAGSPIARSSPRSREALPRPPASTSRRGRTRSRVEEERRARGLLEPEDLDTWLDGHDLDRTDLPEVARRLAVLRWARDAHRDAVAGEMALAVRSDDAYARLAGRAERKRDAVASLPSDRATPGDEELVGWYFRERLGRGGTRRARRLGDGERLASRRRARPGAPTRVVVRVVGRSVGSPR